MSSVEIGLYSWNRFITRNFVILPELLGQVLRFALDGNQVRIKLPNVEQLGSRKGHDQLLSVGPRRAADDTPLAYVIHKVDLEVEIPITLELPQEILTRNANAYDLFTENERKNLNQIAFDHQMIAEKAFEYWIRVLRWKCDDGTLGRPEIDDYRSGWSTYLHDDNSKSTIWIQSEILHVRGYSEISLGKWRETELALQEGEHPPIYVEFMHDGEQNIKVGDVEKGTIDLAIACETFMRSAVSSTLPPELEQSIVNAIESVNIRRYIDSFFPGILNDFQSQEYKELRPDLRTLFEHRNRLVHTGQSANLDHETCSKFVDLTRKLLSILATI